VARLTRTDSGAHPTTAHRGPGRVFCAWGLSGTIDVIAEEAGIFPGCVSTPTSNPKTNCSSN